MKIYLIDDDPNVSNILKIIIQTKALGEVCGIGYSPADALDDLKYIKPDIIVVDLLMPDMDGISFVRKIRLELPDSAFIMLSQVSNKDMIATAYESGIEFFVQKPINAIEVESVLTKVIHSLSMKRTLSGMQTLLNSHMQDMTPKKTGTSGKEPPHMQKAQEILRRLGIIGEIGSRDILMAVEYMTANPDTAADVTLVELCARFCGNPRSAEQHIRRAVNSAMSNLAHLGLEDYANDTFVEYSNTLFNFEQVRREMDYIRGRSSKGGNVKIRSFLNALVSCCCK